MRTPSSKAPASSARIVGVIPARWASTRFPGKSLAPICGKPLIQWVLERAREARRLSSLLVATDDARIRDAVVRLGAEAVMTSPDHPSGTDRIAEAIRGRPADIVINIQGDEPLIDPALIDDLADVLAGSRAWDMATAACPITAPEDVQNPSVVKVVWGQDGQALYFSRSVIPHLREKDSGAAGAEPLYWRHIGIYAYQRVFLDKLVATPPCLPERAEKLEQLRALYLGCRMKVLRAKDTGVGVDTPADVKKAEAALRSAGLVRV
ncbi:MAG: 3-deoxy-manno-octulosonate cytidylyltransferase [Verrucomicrobiota bacterium]